VRRASGEGVARAGLILAAAVASVAAMLAVPAAAAAPWLYTANADVHSAAVGTRDGKLEVRCKGKTVEVAFYMASGDVDPAVGVRPSAIFALRVDNSDQVLWVQSKFVAAAGVTSVGFGGSGADQTARALANATQKVTASLMPEPPTQTTPQYNRTDFPLDGAADAIRAAYAGCGIAW
jgi:hypothetical protein